MMLGAMRPVIYQLFVRHFSNFCRGGLLSGSKEQNGCGTFEGINDAALEQIAAGGFTHIWLTGVLRHATQTDYSAQGLPASDALICKGIAGSPYAVRDYYDLDPDLATDVDSRWEEWAALIARIRHWGMVPMIDLIANHVARDYDSAHFPEKQLGRHDNVHSFFAYDNAFYYMQQGEPPLILPQGVYEPEKEVGRVTGNNAAIWHPSAFDWYETVKLNYGIDYHGGTAAADSLPGIMANEVHVPATWRAMDDIVAFWQEQGVGGFRCDMAHMVPMPFWRWLIARARLRDEQCLLVAEGYNDHMKLSAGDVHDALLDAGFHGVYDAHSYEQLRQLYEGGRWANDLDACHQSNSRRFSGGVRYLENHDEVRLAAPDHWGGVGESILEASMVAQYASSAGPVLFYNGQALGERAEGPTGYGGDNGRTSIFDYTCLPQLQAWASEGRFDGAALTKKQRENMLVTSRLLCLLQDPALSGGEFYGLNWANKGSVGFGRVVGEQSSGHYHYAFLRHHRSARRSMLILCNLAPDGVAMENFELGEPGVQLRLPEEALRWCSKWGGRLRLSPQLHPETPTREISSERLATEGMTLPLEAGHAEIYLIEFAPIY